MVVPVLSSNVGENDEICDEVMMIKQSILIPPSDHVCTGLLSYLLSISCETIRCLSSFLSEK